MDEKVIQKLMDKNEKIINMVIERAKRDFPDDIAIIGLTGSFSTNDFHEKSDLDLIIINNTDEGWKISSCFIFDDVGYDIYCTPWDNIIQKSLLENPGVSSLTDLKILYCSKPEYMDKFNILREKALDALAKPIGRECIERAKKSIDAAKQSYADAVLADDIGKVRYFAGDVLYYVVNSLVNLNNTCIKRGVKRYVEELRTYQYMPEDFEQLYMSLIEAETIDEIKNSAYLLLKSVVKLCDKMSRDLIEQPKPTYDSLNGTYEELWCNCRNKVIVSTSLNDKSYAFLVALGAQNYLDEMTETRGTKKFDLMQYFDADNLLLFKDEFMKIMDEYLTEYDKVGRKATIYDTFEDLYYNFMKK